MLWRKYEQRIADRIDDPAQALLISGARQVGKTYLIRELCRQKKRAFQEFNLIERPEIRDVFEQACDAKDFMQRLSLVARQPLKAGSVLFFDEIQEAEDAVTRMKFLVDEGSYKYVFSGSLLGIEMKDVRSAPVGYLHEITMYPMDFFEFLIALGVQRETINEVKGCFAAQRPVSDFFHEKLMELFYLYLIVGGMPQAVQTYVNTKDLGKVTTIQRDIVSTYKRDFTKYEKQDKLKLISVYDAIPSELNKQNKRFVFTYLNKQLKFDRYENSFLWLKDAGVAIPVYNARSPEPPLLQSRASNLFKLFMNDVGILNSFYPDQVRLKILNREKEINNGALFENAAAQLLLANGITPYYYKNAKHGEIDFLIEKDGSCVPVEIKSGKNFKSHRALSHILESQGDSVKEAFVFADTNVAADGKVRYLPVYMLNCVKDTALKNPVVEIDLSGL